jgi:hypothetical protein
MNSTTQHLLTEAYGKVHESAAGFVFKAVRDEVSGARNVAAFDNAGNEVWRYANEDSVTAPDWGVGVVTDFCNAANIILQHRQSKDPASIASDLEAIFFK